MRDQEFNSEDYTGEDGETFYPSRLKVTCPKCGRLFAALLSKFTEEKEGGWRWVGIDHKEPYTRFQTTCRNCKTSFGFILYTPQ